MKRKKTILVSVIAGILAGVVIMIAFNSLWVRTSSTESCMSCHVHPDSETSWKQSVHYSNGSGTKTDCAACHLPPKGSFAYVRAKMRMGMKDLWSYIFKDK